MHRFIVPALLALAVSLVVGGCGGGGTADNAPGESLGYVPLAVGTQWRYDFTEYTQPAAVRSAKSLLRPRSGLLSSRGLKGKDISNVDVVDVTGTQLIGGSPWFSVVAHYEGGPNEAPAYVRHNSLGFLRKDSLSDAPFYMIQNPIEVGTTWVVTYVSGGNVFEERFAIVAVGQTIIVPAGEYANCVQIENVFREAGQPDDVITYWYAPNVGEVKEERHLGANLLYEMQLNAYTPGG